MAFWVVVVGVGDKVKSSLLLIPAIRLDSFRSDAFGVSAARDPTVGKPTDYVQRV